MAAVRLRPMRRHGEGGPVSTGWQWRDGGSGPGHMQRVRTVIEGQVMEAWRKFVEHALACAGCRGGGRCDMAEALWRAYKNARS